LTARLVKAVSMILVIVVFLGVTVAISRILWSTLRLPDGPYHPLLSLAGLLLAATGVAGIVWVFTVFNPVDMWVHTIESLPREVAHLLGVARGGCQGGVSIVARGPYKCVRHPLYSSALLVFAGLGLVKGFMLLASALLYTVYIIVTEGEERYLDSVTCGEYRRVLGGRPRLNPAVMAACIWASAFKGIAYKARAGGPQRP